MTKMLVSGFGGQGVLTLGEIIANIAMHKGKEVTWMPAYGPEMRGGTANCAVVVSDRQVGSPIVQSEIDILCAMSQPAAEKFIPLVANGGRVLLNSSIVTVPARRDDVTVLEIDATNIAVRVGNVRTQNMVMLAGFLKMVDWFTLDDVEAALKQKYDTKNPKMIALNIKAIEEGLKELIER